MLNKQGYYDYLIAKKRNEKVMSERMWRCDEFIEFLTKNGVTNEITLDDIINFIRPPSRTNRGGEINSRNDFIADYAEFAKSEEANSFPETANNYFRRLHEINAAEFADTRIKSILPAPKNFKVNPKHLTNLTNDEFVAAFTDLQQTIIAIMQDIKKSPHEWGNFNGIVHIIFAFVMDGTHHDGTITVNAKKFFARNIVKRFNKYDTLTKLVNGLKNLGFHIEGYHKKAEEFTVTHLDNPAAITALYAFVSEVDSTKQDWEWGEPLKGFTYRLVEDPAAQKYESLYHAFMDCESPKLQEIRTWWRAEAEKYGFSYTGWMNFTKGSKKFLPLGEENGIIGTKASFIKAWETHPEKMQKLADRFPKVFNLDKPDMCCKTDSPHQFADSSEASGKRCAFRMKFTYNGETYRRCGLENFKFHDLNLDDVKAILEMYLIENKIKQPL